MPAPLILSDPAGDAHGNGSYQLPSQPQPLSPDALDLRQVSIDGDPLVFRVSFGAVQNPWDLPSGYSAGVTDIFVKTNQEGLKTLPDLGLQVAGGWRYHIRVNGAEASLEALEGNLVEGTPTKLIALARPTVHLEGTTLVIQTQIPAGNYGYWVTSSVYSPLSPRGLLMPSDSISPTQLRTSTLHDPTPVDVLATDNTAYITRVLEPMGNSAWITMAPAWGAGMFGLVISLIAWILRLKRS